MGVWGERRGDELRRRQPVVPLLSPAAPSQAVVIFAWASVCAQGSRGVPEKLCLLIANRYSRGNL